MYDNRLHGVIAFLIGMVALLSLQDTGSAVEIADDLYPAATPSPRSLLQTTKITTNKTHRSTGRVRFATVQDRSLAQMGLVAPNALETDVRTVQQAYAQDFLARYGQEFGVRDPYTELSLVSQETDQLGETHLRFQQLYEKIQVHGAQLSVHYDAENRIKAVNGLIVPDLALNPTPRIIPQGAAQIALTELMQNPPKGLIATPAQYHIHDSELVVYRTNLASGEAGVDYLAYLVTVEDPPTVRELVVVNAYKGNVIERVNLLDSTLYREVYNGSFQFQNRIWQEGNQLPYSGTGATDVNNQIAFSEDTYNFMWTLSGGTFDSWDGAGARMRSIYNANIGCPNATWDSDTANFCPDVTSDDVVAHEWAHAYTEGTHNLFYAWQSGALNEAYSDIWGETIDLLNGAGTDDAANVRRINNACTTGGSTVRWLVGEDSSGFNGAIRDMWRPSCFNDPNKVSDSLYWCQTGDNGGVHINSGVPNHAYALLVDGGTFNGQVLSGIGLTKAAHIYWRAQAVYQTPTSTFVDHGDALVHSCQDLIGASLSELSTDSTAITTSSEQIAAADCAELDKAIAAVELMQAPSCNFTPNLAQNPPALCSTPNTTHQSVFTTDWESRTNGWTAGTHSVLNPFTFDAPTWSRNSSLPDARSGWGIYVPNDVTLGNCADDEETGVLYLESSAVAIPTGTADLRLAFDHWFATEPEIDGGNLKIQVNGGAWTLIPSSAFVYNAYNDTLLTTYFGQQITTPLAGEDAFTGTDEGASGGSWGQSQINLSGLASAGDTIRLRFEMGQDGCNGVQGWYVDDVDLYQCVPQTTATPTHTATLTPTITTTPIPTATSTSTATLVPPTTTPTPTATPIPPTGTPVPTATPIPPTDTPMPTTTPTATQILLTFTATPTTTPVPPTTTPTSTATSIPPTPTQTSAPTATPTQTPALATSTPTQIVATSTPTAATATATATTTATTKATPILAASPTATSTPTYTPTSTSTPSVTPTSGTTSTVVPTATIPTPTIPTDPPLSTPTAAPTAAPTASRTPLLLPTATATATATPMATATATATAALAVATITPTATATPNGITNTTLESNPDDVGNINSSLTWVFADDEQTSAFVIYRSLSPFFKATDIKAIDTIPVNSGTLDSATYVLNDPGVEQGQTYYYWVEQILGGGERRPNGPVSVTIPPEIDIYLPLIE